MDDRLEFIEPRCLNSGAVRAYFTTRRGGYSEAPFAGLNLALHVGDDPGAVALNRDALERRLGLERAPFWLDQTHGRRVVCVDVDPVDASADASIARTPGRVCAIMVADCVPLLVCDRAGTQVAAVHAGWRGLEKGVVDAALDTFSAAPADLIAWIGPSISVGAYEVGADLPRRFTAADAGSSAAFEKRGPSWYMDLVHLARIQLERAGVTSVHVDGRCVYRRGDLFYSHRRDGRTGRMAALIWIEES